MNGNEVSMHVFIWKERINDLNRGGGGVTKRERGGG